MTVPLLTQAPLSAPAALGTALTTGKPKSAGDPPRFGMTMWFEVKVEKPTGVSDLGRWSGCAGLGMSMNVDELWSGGENVAPFYLPKSISFDKITLERAMEPGNSLTVQHWLRAVAREWHDSPEGGAGLTGAPGYAGTTVTISMFSSLGGAREDRLVCSWVLTNVIPVSWSVPKFASGSGGIAVESLTLIHRGFLNGESTGGDKLASAGEQAGSFALAYNGDKLEFQYNPAEVTLEKTLMVDEDRIITVGKNRDEYNKLIVSINRFTIEGVTAVRDRTAKLWSWIEPEAGTTGADDKPTPKVLSFTMGTGPHARTINDLCLNSVEVKYTRFTRSGVPCRAEVTLKVVVAKEKTAAAVQGKADGKTAPPKSAATPPPNKAPDGTGREAGETDGVDDLMRPGQSRKAPK